MFGPLRDGCTSSSSLISLIQKVVGWSMGERITSELVCDAFDMAYQRRKPSNILICHSDRGSQYAASEFQKMLKNTNFICSMSRKGNCWDNAVVESFFGSLKTEVVHGNLFRTRNEARRTIFEWIEVTYNKDRTHSSLGYLSPEEYEAEFYSSTALKIESASATNQNATYKRRVALQECNQLKGYGSGR